MDPDAGALASPQEGNGPGRMPEPEAIFAHVGRLLETHDLAGRTVTVTAGPTREALDPVRYLSNHSTGKMGVALAAAAWRRGAEVKLIAGPLSVALPQGICVTHVESTDEMSAAVRAELPTSDVLIMAAAPADFRPVSVADAKLKKANRPDAIAIDNTVDILAATRDARKAGSVIVGFALETDDVLAHAQAKIAAKALDLVVVNNQREAGAGFGGDTNRVTILAPGHAPEELALLLKTEVADEILDRVAGMLHGR